MYKRLRFHNEVYFFSYQFVVAIAAIEDGFFFGGLGLWLNKVRPAGLDAFSIF